MEASNIIQLELFPWWSDPDAWRADDDTRDGAPSFVTTIHRQTEEAAIRRIRIQARIIVRRGRGLKLHWSHNLCLRLERTCMRDCPHYTDVCEWIHERTNFGYRQVNALLMEAGQIIALRELCGLPPLDIEDDAVAIWKKVA